MNIYNFTRNSDGKNIEMRVYDNILEWRYETDLEWKPLLSVDDIGGVDDYEKLSNLPSINGVKLSGDMSHETLKLVKGWLGTEKEFENIKDQLDPDTICHITDDTPTFIETDNSDICIHLSFDSVESCIENIIQNQYDSLFEEPFFGWLKQLHNNYNAKFSLYVSNLQQLGSVPNKYMNEFFGARKWLKFGLCSITKDYVFDSTRNDEAAANWNLFIEQVLRFTGSFESIDRIPKLNKYIGTVEVLTAMRDQDFGALGFLSSPNNESSYYLNDTQNDYLKNHDRLIDFNRGLVFFHTDMCIEWFTENYVTDNNYDIPTETNIIDEIKLRFKTPKFADTFKVFVLSCNESVIYKDNTLYNTELIEDVCNFVNGYCIPFDYPQNRIGDIGSFQFLNQ